MNGSLRIAIAELSLKEKNNRSLDDQGFQERVALRRYCLLLSGADSSFGCRRIKFRIERI